MNVVAELTLKALRPHGAAAWSHYREGLITACRKAPPPYGSRAYGAIYRDAARDPYWMARSLLTNAEREGEGSGHLWDLASSTPDARVATQVQQHAIDESGHSRAYVAMVDLAFPGALDDRFRAELRTLSPGYTWASPLGPHPGSPYAHPVTVDDLIQMNIAEIRTSVHHLLQRPMLLAHAAPGGKRRLARILDALLLDETRHVAYTAALIEAHACRGQADAVKRLMQERQADFNALTNADIGRNVFESV